MNLLKPLKNTDMLITNEQLFIQFLHQEKKNLLQNNIQANRTRYFT